MLIYCIICVLCVVPSCAYTEDCSRAREKKKKKKIFSLYVCAKKKCDAYIEKRKCHALLLAAVALPFRRTKGLTREKRTEGWDCGLKEDVIVVR